MRARLFSILISATVLIPSVASAQDGFESLRTLGMGGAFVGGGTGTGTIFANPAGMAMAGMYAVEAGYVSTPEQGTHGMGIAIADSKTNPSVAGGGSFNYEIDNGPAEGDLDDLRGYDARVVTAFPLLPQQLTLGFSVHYMRHNLHALSQEDADSDGQPDIVDERVQGYTGDIGLMAAPAQTVLLGVTARNLIEVDGSPLRRELEGGVGVYVQNLHAEASWLYGLEDETNTYAIGAEYGFGSVPVRVGYRNGASESVSGGLGWRSATGGLDVAYVHDLNDSDRHLFGLSASYFM